MRMSNEGAMRMVKKTGSVGSYQFKTHRIIGLRKIEADYYAERTKTKEKPPDKRKHRTLTEDRAKEIAGYVRRFGISVAARDLKVSATHMDYVYGEMLLGRLGGL